MAESRERDLLRAQLDSTKADTNGDPVKRGKRIGELRRKIRESDKRIKDLKWQQERSRGR